MMLITLNDVNVMKQKIDKLWEGSTDQFVELAKINGFDRNLISSDQEPNVRLIRDYVSRGILSKPRKKEKKWYSVIPSLLSFLLAGHSLTRAGHSKLLMIFKNQQQMKLNLLYLERHQKMTL